MECLFLHCLELSQDLNLKNALAFGCSKSYNLETQLWGWDIIGLHEDLIEKVFGFVIGKLRVNLWALLEITRLKT